MTRSEAFLLVMAKLDEADNKIVSDYLDDLIADVYKETKAMIAEEEVCEIMEDEEIEEIDSFASHGIYRLN